MRLYRILGAAWAGTQADAKRVAGEHRVPWHETDVPTDKPTLLAWLNERNVPARPEEAIALEAKRAPLAADPMDEAEAGQAKPWILGPAAKDPTRYATKFGADVAAGVEFVPVTKAAEIDRLLERCPMCHTSEEHALRRRDRLDFDGIMAWLRDRATSLELDDVADLIEEKRK